jgi:molybdenum-dependent DNA-binding transcriptional regulator ModE
LGKLNFLEKLNIGVASKNFGYNGYKHVVNGIAQLNQLTDLTLRAGVNRVGGGGAAITKNLIQKLVHLRSLNINFY